MHGAFYGCAPVVSGRREARGVGLHDRVVVGVDVRVHAERPPRVGHLSIGERVPLQESPVGRPVVPRAEVMDAIAFVTRLVLAKRSCKGRITVLLICDLREALPFCLAQNHLAAGGLDASELPARPH